MRLQPLAPRVVQTTLLALVISVAFGVTTLAQSDQRTKAIQLMEAGKLLEALPMLEELAKTTPDDKLIHYHLAFALMGKAANTADAAAAMQLRARARVEFMRARELGDNSELVKAMIERMAPDGSDIAGSKFSQHAQAEKLMNQGEAAFTRGDMDEALDFYQKALALDPKLYYAALFAGDVHTHRGKWIDAETWYQKAIAIDPYIETAYRYSATPLMKQGKLDEARDRYVEAFIVAPYDRLAIGGMVQWAQAAKRSLGHPVIDVPETKVGADGKETTTINVNPLADDGGMAWIGYSATRETWKKEKFAKTFPAEKAYRHSLAEEVDALRSVVSMARTLKAKKLNPQIEMLEKLDKDGLLEAYVLMARPSQGIARDHAGYLRSNRDKLRMYVVKYVIEGGK